MRLALAVAACVLCAGCGAARSHVAAQVGAARSGSGCTGAGCSDYDKVSRWATNRTVAGALVFVQRCETCHTYRDVGTTRLGAPDLTHVGRRLSPQHLLEYIRCPECLNRSTAMPSYNLLPRSTLDALVELLRR